MIDLTQEIVRELLDYNPDTGALTWKERDQKWFNEERHCKAWNNRLANNPALSRVDRNGYLNGEMFGRFYLSHRIIWLWMTGQWPNIIDHINGVTNDNKWHNLRNVDAHENCKNRRRSKTNTSGVTGVYLAFNGCSWVADIRDYLKVRRRWYFKTKEEAILRRKAAEILFGYHPNHGTPSPVRPPRTAANCPRP